MTNTADIYFPTDETEKRFVKSIWRINEFYFHEQTETILPKGTVEIIFNFSDNVTYFNSGLGINKTLPTCFINGINYKPFNLIKHGQQVFLGIQLNAIGLKVLFNVSAKQFNNNVVEGSKVCKSLDALANQLFLKKTFKEQVETMLKWLYVKESESKCFKTLTQIHNLFYSRPINELIVSKLCDQAHLSDRQVRRLSAEWLGMSTETFILYNKYLSALYSMHRSGSSLTQIGLNAGYYDQSHFIREFKSFTDLTPKEYQASITQVPGHIFR